MLRVVLELACGPLLPNPVRYRQGCPRDERQEQRAGPDTAVIWLGYLSGWASQRRWRLSRDGDVGVGWGVEVVRGGLS